jgi:hypothetical protein
MDIDVCNLRYDKDKSTMKPIWKKLTEIEPGLYWDGGRNDEPAKHPWLVRLPQAIVTVPRWYARIGDVPPLPEMPKPALNIDDKILVRDQDGDRWLPRYFAEQNEDGSVKTFSSGATSWSNGNTTLVRWNQWKLPE